jgi:hypothetical protein
MKILGLCYTHPKNQPPKGRGRRFVLALGVASLWGMPGIATAQGPADQIPVPSTHMTVPNGYAVHSSVDVGGRMAGLTGSRAMYDSMINLQTGPRLLGQTFEMHALPENKHPFFDDLQAFSNGYGGDPNNLTRMDVSKNKIYEFSGMFRRDRQYFDYDLLGNPNVPGGQSIPIGPTAAPTGSFAWPQVNQSPFLFNTVRRMTDTSLTLFPVSKVTYRFAYSQNIMQGPSLTPSGYQIAGSYAILLQEYQRNSTDDFTGGIDWKPLADTKLTFEEQVDHYKGDSYFTADPGNFNVQEADGTPVALLASYFNLTPYSSASCNTNSMGSSPLLSAPQMPGGLPVVNPACAVLVSYTRTQPTRVLLPTEIFRFQSASIPNITMNGNARYTQANMNLPAYYDSFQGLSKTMRAQTITANASAKRNVFAADYGVVWQASKKVSIADQINYWTVHQPGTATMTSEVTQSTPATAGNETINSPVLTTATGAAGSNTLEGSGVIGTPLPDYFGQRFVINNFIVTWDATARARFSLTYRYRTHQIGEGIPHNAPLAVGATTNGTVRINEQGGIFTAALRPTENWTLNGSAEIAYDDNAFTPVSPRQLQHYRVHTMYKPRPWATISGAFNDLERHNNTNENALTGATYDGPLNHKDHTRVGSVGATLMPNEHYGLDLHYADSDVYSTTNICYDAGASPTLPGAATPSGTICPGASVLFTNYYEFGPVADFMDAPTQNGDAAIILSPNARLHSNIGYRISSVNGSRFYNDARDVAGSLVSTYQSPYVNLAWTVHPGLIWKAEYNFFGYGEGGPSGAAYCSTSNPTTANPTVPVVPCNSASLAGLPTALNGPAWGATAPRNFHANNVVLSMHYEF